MKELRLILLTLMMTASLFSFAQSLYVHVVQRGETLSCIAQKYNVSETKLKEANPIINKYFYSGMKLVIPKDVNHLEQHTNINSSNKLTFKEDSMTSFRIESNMKNLRKEENSISSNLRFGFYAGFSLNNWYGNDAKGCRFSPGYHAGITVNYRFCKEYLVELNVGVATKGYKKNISDSSGKTWDEDGANYDINGKETLKATNLDLSLLFGGGATFGNNNLVGFKIGPYITYAMSGELENSGSRTTYSDIHSSETEQYGNTSKLKDWKNYEKFGYGLQYSLGASGNHLFFWATYQMGLSKILKKKNAYENAILLTLGYYL